MHELMPDDFLPICRKCIGRDQCYHLTEADSHQRADVGESYRAHSKIFRFFEHLDQDRPFGFEAILRRQRDPAFF